MRDQFHWHLMQVFAPVERVPTALEAAARHRSEVDLKERWWRAQEEDEGGGVA